MVSSAYLLIQQDDSRDFRRDTRSGDVDFIQPSRQDNKILTAEARPVTNEANGSRRFTALPTGLADHLIVRLGDGLVCWLRRPAASSVDGREMWIQDQVRLAS